MSLFSLAQFGTTCGIHTVMLNDEWTQTKEDYSLKQTATCGDIEEWDGFGLHLSIRHLGVSVDVGGYAHTKDISTALHAEGIWRAPVLVDCAMAWDFMSSMVIMGGNEPVLVTEGKGHTGHLNFLYRRGMQSHVQESGRFIRTVWDIEVQIQGSGYDEDGMPLHLITITGQLK